MLYKNHKQYRYKGYDYSQNGSYFVTICTKNRKSFFGKIIGLKKDNYIHDATVLLSNIGKIANKYWLEIPRHFTNVILDEYVIMPNHIHGIIEINSKINGNGNCRNAQWRVPTRIQPLIKNSLSSILNHYKGNVKRCCNKNNLVYFAWQSRFHDRIIRNDFEYNNIRQYILNNPFKWLLDRNNPENFK